MCFSAEASFAGGAVITAVGVATVVKSRQPEQRLFSTIPLLFGLQQFAEGALWITLKSGGYDRLQNAAAYIFLITALVIWPLMVPLSVWFMEHGRNRRKILLGLIAAGGLTSLFYAWCLVFRDVTPRIEGYHILYADNFPGPLVGMVFYLYLLATIVPLFVSSVRRMWLFGILIASSCVVTGIFYSQYLTSVWCFFAALISVSIYWILSVPQPGTNPVPAECHR
jgi:hypothetical protein